MNTSILTLLTITLSISLINCSKKDSDVPSYIPYFTAEDYSGIEKELSDADFYCAYNSNCPNNVGLIFSNIDGDEYYPRISQCTGFLVAKDIVATNSHCIPDRLKSKGADCSSQIAIRFIDNMSTGEKNIYSCSKILDYSPVVFFDPDYSFFRLSKKTDLKPLKIYKNGLKDNQSITIAKVTPLDYSKGGILDMENCKIGLSTLLNLKSTNSWSKTAVGLGCFSENGNSGSPVLNSDNEVLGILQGKAAKEYKDLLEQVFQDYKLQLPDQIIPHMVFTSLSCVADPVNKSFNQKKCKYAESLSMSDCIDFDNEVTKANSDRIQTKWSRALPKIFLYEYLSDTEKLSTTAIPICIKPKESFSNYERFITLKGVTGFQSENINTNYPRSIKFGIRFSVDKEFRLSPEMDFVEELRASFNINITKQDDTWSGTTNSTFTDWYSNIDLTEMKQPVSLPICSEKQLLANKITKAKLPDGDIISEEELKQQEDIKDRKL